MTRLVAIVILLVVAASEYSRAAEPLPPRFGLNASPRVVLAQLAARFDRKVTAVRFPVPFRSDPETEPMWRVPEPFHPDPETDAVYRALLARGIQPIVVLGGWGGAPPPDVYAEQVAVVARTYPEAMFSLWNEPNIAEGGPDPDQTPAAMAKLATAAASAIHGAVPGARVIGPSACPCDGWRAYFMQMYEAIPRGLMDVALHAYPNPAQPLRSIRRAYRMAHRFGRVHVTELDATWRFSERPPRGLNRRAVELLTELGAKTVLIHGAATLRAVLRGWQAPRPAGR